MEVDVKSNFPKNSMVDHDVLGIIMSDIDQDAFTPAFLSNRDTSKKVSCLTTTMETKRNGSSNNSNLLKSSVRTLYNQNYDKYVDSSHKIKTENIYKSCITEEKISDQDKLTNSLVDISPCLNQKAK